MRRHRSLTLPRLKDDVRVELRRLARREGVAGLAARLDALAERNAPSDEDDLLGLRRNSPVLGDRSAPHEAVRAALLEALRRVLADELSAIEKGGVEYLETADRGRG